MGEEKMNNRMGKYYDGSEARKDFIKNRVKNHFNFDGSLGINAIKLKHLAVYFNGAIEELNEHIVNDTREILRDEFDKLGLQTDFLLGEFDMLRNSYQMHRVLCKALNSDVSNN
jgi:hypothetical protein